MMRILVKVLQNHVFVLILLKFLSRVECRRVIQPIEDIENIVKQLNDINLDATDSEGSPCLLDIQEDLPKRNSPQPLYIVPDTNQFWLPNIRGHLQVPHDAAIELYCSNSFVNAFKDKDNMNTNTNILRPHCLHGNTFLWQGQKYEFNQFVCEQPPKYIVEQLHEKCPTMTDDQASVKAKMYRVGFNITSCRFLETMRICYDDTILRTLYVQHILLPASKHFQKFIRRLKFSKAGHLKDVNMNHLYSQQSQQQQAAVLLKGQHKHLFDNSTLFLARGHLAAKSDFIYGNQQRATFNFFNVAPQWQSFNGGQWATLENEVRKFVASSKLLVDCYTGTFGTLQFPYKTYHNDSSGAVSDGVDGGNGTYAAHIIQYRDFHLTKDNNNNGQLPVPKLFYRILIDRSNQPVRGIALVGVNNPHATLNEINESYIICHDIHNQVPWLHWMSNTNLKRGFMYACRVSEFVAAVGYLPKSLLNVTQLLI